MRPLVVENIVLSGYPQLDPASPSITSDIEVVLEERMEEILSAFTDSTRLPLVRLIVDVSGFPAIPVQVFGAKYVGRIANPNSLLLLKRKRILANASEPGEEETTDQFTGFAHFDFMTSLIDKSLKEMGGLKILNQRHMQEARTISELYLILSVPVCE